MTAETQHTPPPCTADGPHNFSGMIISWVRNAAGEQLGRADGSKNKEAEVVANARLWAAAPQTRADLDALLTAAKAVQDWIVDWYTVGGVIAVTDGPGGEVSTLIPAYDALREAVERAEGAPAWRTSRRTTS